MNPKAAALRTGLVRGRIELGHTFVSGQDLWGYGVWPAVYLTVVFFMRNATVPGTDFSLGAAVLPSVLGMGLAFALMTAAATLAIEREDGTLLRAKATPDGMLGYVVAKTVSMAGQNGIYTIVILLGGLVLVGDDLSLSAPRLLTILWVFLLGMGAAMPIGAAIGSLLPGARALGLVFMPLGAMIAISGIFYPITALPGWLQAIGQVFPVYWLGLGMRAALLPDAMAAAEIGGSWRLWETAGVLGLWTVLGLVLAPPLLRRMARRESGSAVEDRRAKALRQVT